MRPYHRQSLLVLLAILTLVLAGCIGIPRRGPVVEDPPVDEQLRVIGTVLSPENIPVANAVVAFQDRTALTDEEGKFAFDEAAEGEHELKVYVQGVISYMGTVVITDKPVDTEITLFENLLFNPTFAGAEDDIPPTGWNKYGTHDEVNTITVLNADDPEKRALLVVDGSDQAEIGLSTTLNAEAGRRYRAVVRVGAVEGEDSRIYLQIRYAPNQTGDRKQITAEPTDTEGFEDWVVELDSLDDTNRVTIYLYTPKGAEPKIRVHSISLWDLGPAE